MKTHLLTSACLALAFSASSALAQSSCSEGCSPNYWKNHKEAWDAINNDDYTQSVKWFMPFNELFGVTPAQSGISNSTDIITAALTSGSGLRALNRQFAAGLANADSLCFGLTVAEVISLYRDAVGADPGPETVSSATTIIVALNGQGCPLSHNPPPPPPTIYCIGDSGDCPCGVDSLIAGCINSSGLGARLDATGSTSITADDLKLVAGQIPANVTVLFLAANTPRRAPFKDGLLCVGGPTSKIYRLPPLMNSGPSGLTCIGPGLVALSNTPLVPVPGGIQAGETWYFQTYFRDMQGCGGTANLSNALALTFTP